MSHSKERESFNLRHSIQILTRILNQINQAKFKWMNQKQSNPYKLYLMFGKTPSGKTLTQYYLCEDKLIFQVDPKTKIQYLIPEKVYDNATVPKLPVSITTRIPNLRVRTLENIKIKILFLQIPDIEQLNKQEKTMVYLLLKIIFSEFTKVHILLVVEQSNFDQCEDIIKQLQCITNLFQILDLEQKSSSQSSNLEEKRQFIYHHMSLIINKIQSDHQSILQKLDQINDQIFEQNEIVGRMLKTLIREDRVYFIRNQQPDVKQDQHKLFQQIVQKSQTGWFKEFKLTFFQLLEIIQDEQSVNNLIEQLSLKKIWKDSIQTLKNLLNYLKNTKKRKQFQEPIKILIEKQNQRFQINVIEFQGKLHPKIKSAFTQLFKILPYEIESEIQKFPLSIILDQFSIIKSLIQQVLGISQNKQGKQSSQKDIQISKNNRFFYNLLRQNCQQITCLVSFVLKILNYNPQVSQQQENKLQINKACLKQLSYDLLRELYQNLKHFKNLGGVRIPPVTFKKLYQQFKKVNAKNKNAILQTIKLPNNSFKLHILVSHYFSNGQPDGKTKFKVENIILKQISKILQIYKYDIDSIKFLIRIPDWNKIQQIIDRVINLNYKLSEKTVQEKNKDIRFLTRLSNLSKLKRRKILQQKIEKVMAKISKQYQQIGAQYSNEKDCQQQVVELIQLGSSNQYSIIVQMIKNFQQSLQKQQRYKQLRRQIQKQNTLRYVMIQDLKG